jgi:hypothetical protein
MRRTLGLLVVCLISGCAHERDVYYSPSVLGGSIASVATDDGLLRLNTPDSVLVRVFECGIAYRRPDLGPVALCMTIVPEERAKVHFASSEFHLLDRDGRPISTMTVAELRYYVLCYTRLAEVECTSSLSPSVEGPVSRSTSSVYRGALYSETFTFSPLQDFEGALDYQLGLREYLAYVEFPAISDEEVRVSLPALLINGERIALPEINLRRTLARRSPKEE